MRPDHSRLIASIESRIGPGPLAEDPVSSKLPAPPWWLIAASALALLAMFGDVQKVIFQ